MVRLKDHNPHNKIKMSFGEAAYSVFNYVIVTLVAMTMLYPILNILAVSLSNYYEYLKSPWMIWPKGLNGEAYKFVFANSRFWRSYGNSIFITVTGTVLGLLITALTAYPLSRRELKGKPVFMGILIFTMVFSAGMIPGYLNAKELGLLNNIWVLIIPGCFGAYNTILMISFFKGIPYDYIEAATIDGASEPYIFFRVILPLSKPVLASIALFLAVGYWNSYFGAQIYIRDRELWPMALMLKEMLTEASTKILEAENDAAALGNLDEMLQPTTLQYASVIVATVPILCVYPFLQKYFAKGVMLGGVKG